MSDWIEVRGPERAVFLFDTRLVGMNADNAKKLLFTPALIVIAIVLSRVGRAVVAATLRDARRERPAFWARQAMVSRAVASGRK